MLFNCKYSMRQVEDEVREEERKKNVGYRIGYGGGDAGGSNGDAVGNEEGEEEEECGWEVQGAVGREDGYVNVNNVGRDCGDYAYDDKEGCDADEFSKLGLDCCSIVGGEVDDEAEAAGHAPLLLQQQQRQHPPTNTEEMEGGDCWEHVKAKSKRGESYVEVGAGAVSQSMSPHPHPFRDALSKEQKAERSWKDSNPSLDMLLYRTMLNK